MSLARARHVGGRAGAAVAGWAVIGGQRIYFRSRRERRYAEHLEMLRQAGAITSWEHEPRRFEFPLRRGTNSYLPDFRVVFADGRVEWHEVKGWMDGRSRVALERMLRHYPDEVVLVNGVPASLAIAQAKAHDAARKAFRAR